MYTIYDGEDVVYGIRICTDRDYRSSRENTTCVLLLGLDTLSDSASLECHFLLPRFLADSMRLASDQL